MLLSELAPRKYWTLNEDYIDGVMGKLGGLGLITNESKKHQIYTLKHQQAFIAVQLQLYGTLTPTALKHDTDKLVTYGILGKQKASGLHRKYALHHVPNWSSMTDIIDGITDFECARFTKPDKPLNAYDTVMKYYPSEYSRAKAGLSALGIDGPNTPDYKLATSSVYNKLLYRLLITTSNVIDGMVGLINQGIPIDTVVKLFYTMP